MNGKCTRSSLSAGLCWLGIVAVLCLGSASGLCDSEPSTEAEGMLARQHGYIQGMSSLEFRLTTLQTYEGDSPAIRRTKSTEARFVHAGEKYRVEVTSMNSATGATVTRAYDGELYQTLVSIGEKKQLIVSRSRPSNFHYGNPHPLLTLEHYATGCGQENSLEGMREIARWSELSSCVSSITESAIQGWDGGERTGTILRMHRPFDCEGESESEIEYRITLDPDLGYLPSRWEAVMTSGRQSDCTVSDVTKIATPSGEIAFPLRLERTYYSAEGELTGTMTLQVDEDSLRVNEPVDESEFTLPKTGTYYIDADAGVEMQL